MTSGKLLTLVWYLCLELMTAAAAVLLETLLRTFLENARYCPPLVRGQGPDLDPRLPAKTRTVVAKTEFKI